MTSKTFSSRVDEAKLDFADLLTRQKYGMSFGQYCGTILIDAIEANGCIPDLDLPDSPQAKRQKAISFVKNFADRTKNSEIGRLSDEEIKDLIASRYE